MGRTRRKIIFPSFRTFVKSVISIQTTADFCEWFLGHSYSTYWNIKETERRELYKKCMKYLTFLDYPIVSTVGRDFESKLEERDMEISSLMEDIKKLENERESMSSKIQELEKSHIKGQKEMDERVNQLKMMYTQNPKLAKVKPGVLKKKINLKNL